MYQSLRYVVSEILALAQVLPWSGILKLSGCITMNLYRLARDNSFRAVDDCMSAGVVSVKALGQHYVLINPDFALIRELYARTCYFPDATWVPNANELVVDLGANAGLFSLLCAKRGCDVIAVEAQSGFCTLLTQNLDANQCRDKVMIIHALVGAQSGEFASRQSLMTASHFVLEPEAKSMDEIIGMAEGRPISLLKMDIEGSEFSLFSERVSWTSSVKRIAMEVHPSYGSVDSLIDKLRNMGYECRITPHWREPQREIRQYPGYLFAWRSTQHE